jgi:hypothetical protein
MSVGISHGFTEMYKVLEVYPGSFEWLSIVPTDMPSQRRGIIASQKLSSELYGTFVCSIQRRALNVLDDKIVSRNVLQTLIAT